jgi:hypothetical protein
MARTQEVRESMRDFQSDLDQRNTLALDELNRQIDELATIPLRDLDPFMDSIDYIQPSAGYSEQNSPAIQKLITKDFKLDKDLIQKDYFLDSKLDSMLMSRGSQDNNDIKNGTSFDNGSVPDLTQNQSYSLLDPNLSLNGLSFDTRELLKQLENQELTIEDDNGVVASSSKGPEGSNQYYNQKKEQEIIQAHQKRISIESNEGTVPMSAPLKPKSDPKDKNDVQLSLETLNLLSDLKNPQYEYFGLQKDNNKPTITSPLKDTVDSPSGLRPKQFSDLKRTDLSDSTRDLLAQLSETKTELDHLNVNQFKKSKVFEPTHVNISPLYSQLDLLENDGEYPGNKKNRSDSPQNKEKHRVNRNDFKYDEEIQDDRKNSNHDSRFDSTHIRNYDKPKNIFLEDESSGENFRGKKSGPQPKQFSDLKRTDLSDSTRDLLAQLSETKTELDHLNVNQFKKSKVFEPTHVNISPLYSQLDLLENDGEYPGNKKNRSDSPQNKEKHRVNRNDFKYDEEIQDDRKNSNHDSRFDSTHIRNYDKPKNIYLEDESSGENSRGKKH